MKITLPGAITDVREHETDREDIQDAVNRWKRQTDLSEFETSSEAWDSFYGWIRGDRIRKNKIGRVKSVFEEEWEKYVSSKPPEEAIWHRFVEEHDLSKEDREKFKKAYKKALKEDNPRSAWGKFFGSLPKEKRKSKEAKALFEKIKERYVSPRKPKPLEPVYRSSSLTQADKEKLISAYSSAIRAKNQKEAWGKFFGKAGNLKTTQEAKELWKSVKLKFIG